MAWSGMASPGELTRHLAASSRKRQLFAEAWVQTSSRKRPKFAKRDICREGASFDVLSSSHEALGRHAARPAKARPRPRGSVASVVACSDGALSVSSHGASSAYSAPLTAPLCIECGSLACRADLIAPWGVRTCGRLCEECELCLFRPHDWEGSSDFVE